MRGIVFGLAAAIMAAATAPAFAADVANGNRVFTGRCALCHSAMRGGPNKLGPNLFGIMGRRAATVPGFPFSTAMRKSYIVWSDATMRAYLSNPARTVPGGKMAFAGINNAQVMDDMIAYLKTLR